MTVVYKIFRASEQEAFQRNGSTPGAPVDIADGYVHMSTRDQVVETAAKHFSGEAGLKILGIETDGLGDALRWEPSRGGALFPHLYRELRLEDVLWTRDLPLVDGAHDFIGLIDS